VHGEQTSPNRKQGGDALWEERNWLEFRAEKKSERVRNPLQQPEKKKMFPGAGLEKRKTGPWMSKLSKGVFTAWPSRPKNGALFRSDLRGNMF